MELAQRRGLVLGRQVLEDVNREYDVKGGTGEWQPSDGRAGNRRSCRAMLAPLESCFGNVDANHREWAGQLAQPAKIGAHATAGVEDGQCRSGITEHCPTGLLHSADPPVVPRGIEAGKVAAVKLGAVQIGEESETASGCREQSANSFRYWSAGPARNASAKP